jgi:prefoldin subunit 5
MDACNRIYDKNTSEIAKLLIDAGADITFVNERNESALSILSKTIMQRINGSEWKFNQEIFEVYEILNKKIKEIAEYRKTHDKPDEEFIKKNSGENDLPF